MLAKIQRLDLLIKLYNEVIIPESVIKEVAAKPGEEEEQIQSLLKRQIFLLRKAEKAILNQLSPDPGPVETK